MPRWRFSVAARLRLAVAAMVLAAPLARAEPPAPSSGAGASQSDQVRPTLVADAAAIAPGTPFRVAVRLAMKDGWHVNWLNPGDAGLAPSIAWHLPAGFKVGTILWPMPRRVRTGPIVIFGYAGEVLLIADVTPPETIREGTTAHLAADVSWLACAESCVPGGGSVALDLPVEAAPRPDPSAGAAIDAAEATCPAPAGVWTVNARLDGQGNILMDVQSAEGGRTVGDDIFFFPYEPGYIDNAAPQTVSVLQGLGGRAAYQLRIELSRLTATVPSRVSGILTSKQGWSDGSATPGAIEVDVPLSR